MQLPFGLELFWPRDSGEWVAWATLVLVMINAVYVRETRRTVTELREARFTEILPMLRWQQPEAFVVGALRVLLTNEGPGPARILDATIESSRPTDVWSFRELAIPSTLPSEERIVLTARTLGSPVEAGNAEVAIAIRYEDLLGQFEYETRVRLALHFRVQLLDDYGQPTGMGSTANFIDSDERSALERRLRPQKGRAR